VSFFKRYPKFWITYWTVFGFGGLVMTANAIFGQVFDPERLVKGLIGIAVAGMMIGYLIPELRIRNAED
jgi:uncharacterized membrane protein YccC